LLERLRARRMLETAGRLGSGTRNATNAWLTNTPDPDCAEAADELERLQSLANDTHDELEQWREECARLRAVLKEEREPFLGQMTKTYCCYGMYAEVGHDDNCPIRGA